MTIFLILVAFIVGWLSASFYRLTVQPPETTANSMPKEEYEAMTARIMQRDHEMRIAQLASLNCR